MFVYSLPWNLRGTRYLAPEGGAGGGEQGASGEAAAPPAPAATAAEKATPARYGAEDIEGLGEGSELLLGAPIGEAVQGGDDLPDEWTPENAGGEQEVDGVSEDGASVTESDTETPKDGNTETPAEDGATETPKDRNTETLLNEARSEVARLSAEIETLKNAAPPPAPEPTRENPLANIVSTEALRSQERLAIDAEEWADEHRDGGPLPRELQAALEGRKVDEISEPRELTAAEAMTLLKNSKRMLREHLPARREYLQREAGVRAFWQQHHPEYLDASKPEGQLVQAIERQWPGLKHNPAWVAACISMARGSMAFEKEAKGNAERGTRNAESGKPETQKHGNTETPPLAPVPPRSNGARTSTSRPATPKPAKLRVDMTDDELAETM